MSHDKLVQDASVPVSEQPTRQSALYDRVAEQTASMIIREYSTSFGLAARLYESAPVRNQMLKLAQTKAGSAEEAALAKRLLATIQTQAEAIQAKAQEAQE